MVTGDDDDEDDDERDAPKRPGLARTRPWQAPRTGAAMRLGSEDELLTLVSFDVPSDRHRRLVGEVCKDYGLRRLQWSVFEGPMPRNRREELWERVVALLEEAPGGGKLAVFPIGAREAAFAQREHVEGEPVRRALPGGGEED